MAVDTATIRTRLEGLHNLPTPVRAWRVEEGLDATEDPAVWIWALIEESDADADTLWRLKWMARDVARDATGLWAYVLVRGADEAEAAAFVDLQQHRHEADYDLRRRFTRLEVLSIISDERTARRRRSASRAATMRVAGGIPVHSGSVKRMECGWRRWTRFGSLRREVAGSGRWLIFNGAAP